MARLKDTKKVAPVVVNVKYEYDDEVLLPNGFYIVKGEIFKVGGKSQFGVSEWGARFKFDKLVTHIETGKQWVDCYEMFRGKAGVMRSFPIERIKRIPKKRRKRVSGNKPN